MHILSPPQRSKLLANRNVLKITEKHIVFTPGFKLKAVELFLEGISAQQIFIDAQIPIEYFKHDYCKYCLKKWVAKYNSSGAAAFLEDGRGSGGGRPKNENLSFHFIPSSAVVWISDHQPCCSRKI